MQGSKGQVKSHSTSLFPALAWPCTYAPQNLTPHITLPYSPAPKQGPALPYPWEHLNKGPSMPACISCPLTVLHIQSEGEAVNRPTCTRAPLTPTSRPRIWCRPWLGRAERP